MIMLKTQNWSVIKMFPAFCASLMEMALLQGEGEAAVLYIDHRLHFVARLVDK